MVHPFLFRGQKGGEEKRLCPITGVSYVAGQSSVLLTSHVTAEKHPMGPSVRVASESETRGSLWQLAPYMLSSPNLAARYLQWWR